MSALYLSVVVVIVDHCALWLGLTVSLFWTKGQIASHGIVVVKKLLFHFIFTYRIMFSLSYTALVLSPGFACFCVRASVRFSKLVYIFLMNIY